LKLIVGLGNIGRRYQFTRHNIGFMVMDRIAKKHYLRFSRSLINEAYIANKELFGEEVLLVKPTTFMNRSGKSVKKIIGRYRIDIKDLLVVYDDADLPLGALRYRPKGSSGGHQGMESIIESLGSEEIKRLRIGIGRPKDNQPLEDYVLTSFAEEEKPIVENALSRAEQCCYDWLSESEEVIMQRYNQ